MRQFDNVSVVAKANVYFDGRVISHTVLFPDGSRKTLGVLLPGEYEFGTAEKELMEIEAGEVEVLLPGAGEWTTQAAGSSFAVPAKAKFQLRVRAIAEYVCSYLGA